MRRWLAMLGIALALCASGGVRQALSQDGGADGIALGGLSIVATTGYASFALPVANAALGRDWAKTGGFAWQAAYNYSTIPLRVDIVHRFPFAFRARLEVISPHGYAREEAPLRELTLASCDVLVPPSVPMTFMLAPRACPPSVSGGTARLILRVTQLGNNVELTRSAQPVTVLQLEPAHVYSLYLDGPRGDVFLDHVNAGNKLKIALPARSGIDPHIFETRNYTISVERQQVTLLPLAARDFAFVFADAHAVRSWPEEEQHNLAAFVIGGGRLCLFNTRAAANAGTAAASRSRQALCGLPLDAGPQAAGRGFLLPVNGGFDKARAGVADWLGGELAEFALLIGGSEAGKQLVILPRADLSRRSIKLLEIYSPATSKADYISHRPGFLHPLWLYRETFFSAALEPWDYPEFSQAGANLPASNTNLQLAFGNSAMLRLPPLRNLATAERSWPLVLIVITALLPLLLGAAGLHVKPRWLMPLTLTLAVVAACAAWWRVAPAPPPAASEVVYDADIRCDIAARREVLGAFASRGGELKLPLPPGALIRRVSSDTPGGWRQSEAEGAAQWRGTRHAGFAAVFCDSQRDAPAAWPVGIRATRAGRRLNLRIDTSALGPEQQCYLITPLGMSVLPGGLSDSLVELDLPALPVRPGYERLAASERLLFNWRRGVLNSLSTLGLQTDAALRQLNAPTLLQDSADAQKELQRLGLQGLLQNPCTLRGTLLGQGVLIAPLDGTAIGEEAARGVKRASFVRLTFPLEEQP